MSPRTSSILIAAGAAVLAMLAADGEQVAHAQMITRTQNFNSDPGWEGRNNRATQPEPRAVTQDFGWKVSNNVTGVGSPLGEVGGFITPVGEQAYYGKVIAPLTFNDTLTASGQLKLDGGGNVELGFFNNTTVNEWRTPNTVAFRLYGRGPQFIAYTEYGTSRWRAGANESSVMFNSNQVYNWTLNYNPAGNNGGGTITGTIGGHPIVTNLDPSHKLDGATFNRFGFLNISKSHDSPGNFWIDDVNINGVGHAFGTNPGWEGLNNTTNYVTTNVRPRFDFGFSGNTNHAGGAGAGEMGGHLFRGDSRAQFNGALMAYYGDPLPQTLDLTKPLQASGKVSFNRGVSDSTTMIGFFHDAHSNMNDELGRGRDFLGAVIEGPSSEGHLFYPGYLTDQLGTGAPSRGQNLPYIYPNGDSHDWTLNYDPNANNGNGRITLSLDGQQGFLDLAPGHKAIGAHFNRFGIITPHIDGNGQTVWFDDLTYTVGFGTDATWAGDFSGDWHNASSWVGGTGVPNAIGAKAVFANNNTSGRTAFANNATTVGTLNFASPQSWLVTGLGSLTLQVASGSAQVNVTQGAHKINLPVTIASNTVVTVAGGAQLTVSDPVTVNAGRTLTHSGAGQVTYQSTFQLGSGAVVSFAMGAELESLAMAADATVDLAGGEMIVRSGDYDDIHAKVKQGFNGGDWRGDGITSAAAANDPNDARGLAVVETGGGVVVKNTWYGDANVSGVVDLDDVEIFVARYDDRPSDAAWIDADFDLSGGVDLRDFDQLLLGLRYQPTAEITAEVFDALQAFVTRENVNVDLTTALPEPAAAGVMAMMAGGMLMRRRRSRGSQ